MIANRYEDPNTDDLAATINAFPFHRRRWQQATCIPERMRERFAEVNEALAGAFAVNAVLDANESVRRQNECCDESERSTEISGFIVGGLETARAALLEAAFFNLSEIAEKAEAGDSL